MHSLTQSDYLESIPMNILTSLVEGNKIQSTERGCDQGQAKIVKKWSKEEIKKWMSCILKHIIDFPYSDLQDQLILSSNKDRIYRILQNSMESKSSKQCQKFTKKAIYRVKKQTQFEFLEWVVSRIKREKDIESMKLIEEYQRKINLKLEYMKAIDQLREVISQEKIVMENIFNK